MGPLLEIWTSDWLGNGFVWFSINHCPPNPSESLHNLVSYRVLLRSAIVQRSTYGISFIYSRNSMSELISYDSGHCSGFIYFLGKREGMHVFPFFSHYWWVWTLDQSHLKSPWFLYLKRTIQCCTVTSLMSEVFILL